MSCATVEGHGRWCKRSRRCQTRTTSRSKSRFSIGEALCFIATRDKDKEKETRASVPPRKIFYSVNDQQAMTRQRTETNVKRVSHA